LYQFVFEIFGRFRKICNYLRFLNCCVVLILKVSACAKRVKIAAEAAFAGLI
jgi:hypothetical protein